MTSTDSQIDRWSQALRGRARKVVASSSTLSLAYLRVARSMTMLGISPPLSGSAESQERRWHGQGRQGSSDSPESYLDLEDSGASIFSEVVKMLPEDARILEIGCNAGRNLNYLYRHGFTNLWGIEIGPLALKKFGEVFPNARESTHVTCGNAVEEIRSLPTDYFDLVFTRSVLVNIHPKHDSLFSQMARVCRGYILSSEMEGSWTAWPRDFTQLFNRHGFALVSKRYQEPIGPVCGEADEQERILNSPIIRLFTRDSKATSKSHHTAERE